MTIRLLEQHLINQIAAGEVIERPASAMKELVENAIDAGAKSISVTLRDGGRSLISVKDDGIGMDQSDLEMCVQRHATSKIPDNDLFNISTMGFRGEALPSIGSVSRLHITSHKRGQEDAWVLKVEGGIKQDMMPAVLSEGTLVEVRDLFYATPARLKFLKSPSTEFNHAQDFLNRLAMSHPNVSFKLFNDKRQALDYKATSNFFDRLEQILGTEFSHNSIPIKLNNGEYGVEGFISLPTMNRASAQHQYLFVNERPVKDKILAGAIRASFQDFLAKDRHPVVALFVRVPNFDVDMNVHPAKIEVRFRDSQRLRGLMVSAIREALVSGGHKASTTVAEAMVKSFVAPQYRPQNLSYRPEVPKEQTRQWEPPVYGQEQSEPEWIKDRKHKEATTNVVDHEPISHEHITLHQPLGRARTQVHSAYIISETQDGIIIVDQHAAHERLVYEALKQDRGSSQVVRQPLLIPQVIELSKTEVDKVLGIREELASMGVIIEPFGDEAVLLREVPVMLGNVDGLGLIKDIVDELQELDQSFKLKEKIDHILATIACHGSVRSGRVLKDGEMDSLLRQMESTPHSGQCNHGRPTYVELKLKDIDRLFGRT